MDKQKWKVILIIVSGVKYHFVACMAICNVHNKLLDLLSSVPCKICHIVCLVFLSFSFQTCFLRVYKL